MPDESVAKRVEEIASEFVDGYFGHYPEEVYEVGYPNAPDDRFGDHSTASREAWETRVDGWIEALDGLDRRAIAGTPAETTYLFAKDRLQALLDRRVCKMALWNVSPTWTGWQYMIISTLAVQPVDSDAERQSALRRADDVQRFVEMCMDQV